MFRLNIVLIKYNNCSFYTKTKQKNFSWQGFEWGLLLFVRTANVVRTANDLERMGFNEKNGISTL